MNEEQAMLQELMYNVNKCDSSNPENYFTKNNERFNYAALEKPYGLKDNTADKLKDIKIGYDMQPDNMYKPEEFNKKIIDSYSSKN